MKVALGERSTERHDEDVDCEADRQHVSHHFTILGDLKVRLDVRCKDICGIDLARKHHEETPTN